MTLYHWKCYAPLNTVSPNGIVSSTPMLIIASRGDDVTLTCHTEAGPNVTYMWMYRASDFVCPEANCSNGIFAFTATEEGIYIYYTNIII